MLARRVEGSGTGLEKGSDHVSSVTHEALLLLFRNRPTLAAEVLREMFHKEVPAFARTQIVSIDVTEVIPAERRSDLVVLLEGESPLLAIIIEAQLHRDTEKQYAWPVYVAGVRARHRCPTWLLVVTTDPGMVSWCATSIELGHPGHVLTPLVLGPKAVPIVTEPGEAQKRPELSVLSALAHGQSEAGEAIGVAFLGAAAGLDEDRRAVYGDLVLSSLNEAARRKLEEMMSSGYQFQSEFARSYVAKGKLEGLQEGTLKAKAQAVLAVLEARGLEVSTEVRERVLASTDLAELDRWIRRAAVVSDARELFAGTSS
jgi:hypothetical protein